MKTNTVPPPARANDACAPWVTLLPDAVEGLLNDAEQRALDFHLAECSACTLELAEAQRGFAWLTVLKEYPPGPPPDMLADILARTTGMVETGVMLPPLPVATAPVAGPSLVVAPGAWAQLGRDLGRWIRGEEGTWSSLLQPRLAMTGAMAFFSICLTVNLLGISVSQLDAQSFRKGGLERTVAKKRASLVRSIEGLRVVYRVESRVNEMRAQMDNPGETSPAR